MDREKQLYDLNRKRNLSLMGWQSTVLTQEGASEHPNLVDVLLKLVHDSDNEIERIDKE